MREKTGANGGGEARGRAGVENAKGRDRKERPRRRRDRILRRSIKSWRVQSFLRDDPGNGRAVALLIPLPAANFSPFLLSLFFLSSLRFLILSERVVSLSSPSLPIPPRSPCRLTPFSPRRSFSLSYPSSCIMRYVPVILSTLHALKPSHTFVPSLRYARRRYNIFIGPRMTHIIHTNEAAHMHEDMSS